MQSVVGLVITQPFQKLEQVDEGKCDVVPVSNNTVFEISRG